MLLKIIWLSLRGLNDFNIGAVIKVCCPRESRFSMLSRTKLGPRQTPWRMGWGNKRMLAGKTFLQWGLQEELLLHEINAGLSWWIGKYRSVQLLVFWSAKPPGGCGCYWGCMVQGRGGEEENILSSCTTSLPARWIPRMG